MWFFGWRVRASRTRTVNEPSDMNGFWHLDFKMPKTYKISNFCQWSKIRNFCEKYWFIKDSQLTIFYHSHRKTFLITTEWAMRSSLFIDLTIFTPQADILSIFLDRTLGNMVKSDFFKILFRTETYLEESFATFTCKDTIMLPPSLISTDGTNSFTKSTIVNVVWWRGGRCWCRRSKTLNNNHMNLIG